MKPALGTEYLSIGQPRVIVHDAILMVLQLDDEIAVVLDPADDEYVRSDAGQLDRNHLIDFCATDQRLYGNCSVDLNVSRGTKAPKMQSKVCPTSVSGEMLVAVMAFSSRELRVMRQLPVSYEQAMKVLAHKCRKLCIWSAPIK